MPHCPAISRAVPGSIKAASLPEFTEKQTGMDIGQIATSQGRSYLSNRRFIRSPQDGSGQSTAWAMSELPRSPVVSVKTGRYLARGRCAATL